eukprot:5504964-Amphidinium_carterae.5
MGTRSLCCMDTACHCSVVVCVVFGPQFVLVGGGGARVANVACGKQFGVRLCMEHVKGCLAEEKDDRGCDGANSEF